MAIAIFPLHHIRVELIRDFEIPGAIINSFGRPYEQRIITSLPRGPRADGEGTLSTFVGESTFRLQFSDILYPSTPFGAGNTNLDNSIRALWSFFKDLFYDATANVVKWDPFYIYDPAENDDKTTWKGDTVANGTNSRSEAVTNQTGRYLVRTELAFLSISQVRSCFFNSSFVFVEVAA